MTPTEMQLIDVLTKGLKLQRSMPIVPETTIFGRGGGGGEGKDGLGLDSVDVLEIAVLVDKHFGVMLEEQSDEVHGALVNIGTLAGYIDRHKAA